MWKYWGWCLGLAGMILGTTVGWTQDTETLRGWNWQEKKVIWQKGEGSSEQRFEEIQSWGKVASCGEECFLVVLASGGWLVGNACEAADEGIRLETVSLGKMEIPLERCAGILFPPDFSPKTFSEHLKKLLTEEFFTDTLELRNGDMLTGEWIGWKEGNVWFQPDYGNDAPSLTLKPSMIRRLILASRLRQKERDREIPLLLVGLRDGSLFPVYETDAIQEKLDAVSGEEVVYLESCRVGGNFSEITEGHLPVSSRLWRKKIYPFEEETP